MISKKRQLKDGIHLLTEELNQILKRIKYNDDSIEFYNKDNKKLALEVLSLKCCLIELGVKNVNKK